MAKVQVQVVVDRKQVDKLSSDLDKLNNRKINIETKEFQREMSQAAEATGKAADNLKKFVQVQDGAGQVTKEIHEYNDGLRTTVQYTDKLNKETGELELAQKKITTTYKDATKAESEADKIGKEHNETVKQQGLLYDILGRSVSSFLLRMTAYRAVYAGIRAITGGFKEALETLKAVDDELVTVRKVTGFDQYQMANVEEQAYAVASKYGTSAADYTSSVAAFARAGYKELSGDLAELAEKTKIVGDTTADVAQQFLLSVDAAYKYNGEIEKLSAVLDGANEIDNKFATSIEKIAEGMGIVAPVAAQMNVGVDELAASIGTITAVTQRTGTEAARALRAIYLNIVGDTKTEIEEGVTWTTGEIEGLRDVIKLYAKDAWDAAQASGGIIDPMEAIAGLAQSVKDGVLSEAKLMEMVSDIGGKLRTSQLLAIVNNWDMYESMLETYRNAYGSADAEVENAMDSWSRKTEVLKNTWTQFVKTGLDSEFFKDALDTLTAFVERLGTLPDLLTRLIPLVAAIKLREMAKDIADTSKAATGLAGAFEKIGVSSKALNIAAGAVAALGVAWSVASYLIEDARIKHEQMVKETYEEADAADESTKKIIELYGQMEQATAGTDEFKSAAKELADTLGVDVPAGVDAAIQKIKEYTSAQLTLNAARTNEAKRLAEDEFLSAVGGAYKVDINSQEIGGYNDIIAAMAPDLAKKIQGIAAGYTGGDNYDTLENARAYRDTIREIVDAMELYNFENQESQVTTTEYYKRLKEFLAETETAYGDLAEKEQQAFDSKIAYEFTKALDKIPESVGKNFGTFISTVTASKDYTNEEKNALIELAREYFNVAGASGEAADGAEKHTEAVKAETDALDANQKALDENASASERAAAAKKDAEAAARKFCDALFDENGELTAAGKAALQASDYLADLTQAELNARLEAAKANYASLRAQLAGVSTEALKAAYAMMAYMEAAQDGQLDPEAWKARRTGGYAYSLMSQIAALEKEINSISVQATAVAPYTSSYSSASSSSGRSSGSSSGKSSGGSGKSSSSSSTSTEDKKLTSLKERVTLLKSELSLMKERGDSETSQIAKMREIQKALKAESAYLEKIKGDKATINGLETEWWQYENSITDMMDKQAQSAKEQADALQKALEAQLALNNALKDRSVRYYNAKTGQWEWGANQQNVQSAYAAYQSAYSNLPEAQRSAFAKQGLAMTGYGASASLAEFLSRISGGGGSSVYNYGSTYNLGGVSLSEAAAKAMSVFDLAMLSNSLAIHA